MSALHLSNNPKIGRLMAALGAPGAGPCEQCDSENVHTNLAPVSGRDRIVYQCQECMTTWADVR